MDGVPVKRDLNESKFRIPVNTGQSMITCGYDEHPAIPHTPGDRTGGRHPSEIRGVIATKIRTSS